MKKLSAEQKIVIRRLRLGGYIIGNSVTGHFYGGGCGSKINGNTIHGLIRNDLITSDKKLSEKGMTINI